MRRAVAIAAWLVSACGVEPSKLGTGANPDIAACSLRGLSIPAWLRLPTPSATYPALRRIPVETCTSRIARHRRSGYSTRRATCYGALAAGRWAGGVQPAEWRRPEPLREPLRSGRSSGNGIHVGSRGLQPFSRLRSPATLPGLDVLARDALRHRRRYTYPGQKWQQDGSAAPYFIRIAPDGTMGDTIFVPPYQTAPQVTAFYRTGPGGGEALMASITFPSHLFPSGTSRRAAR